METTINILMVTVFLIGVTILVTFSFYIDNLLLALTPGIITFAIMDKEKE